MGAEDGDRDESPAHRVTVRDFHMAKYMVTFDQYDAYCNDAGIPRPYDTSWGRGNLPVINVNWFDAVRYCNWLSRKEGLTQPYTIRGKSVKWNREADGYRLPTEAEWEFAARGGNLTLETLFPGSNNPKEVAWYGRNSGGITHPVGTKQPNELGLYDMSGNLWEWCWDWHGRYSAVDQSDPIGPKSGRYRVLRGGSWCNNNVMVLRITNRSWDKPVDLGNYIGFRLALPVTE